MKYIVNTTKMAFKFQNGTVLEKKAVIEANDKLLSELSKDYMFNGLKARKAITVSEQKPESIIAAGAEIATNKAELEALRKENERLKAELEKAQSVTVEAEEGIDSESGVTVEAEEGKEKKGKK
jgi:hypothetical protein